MENTKDMRELTKSAFDKTLRGEKLTREEKAAVEVKKESSEKIVRNR